MKYSFSAIASRLAVTALLSNVVAIGSTIPAAASQSLSARPAVIVCPPQSVVSVAEHAIEALFFGASDPCGLATAATPSRGAAITGPVHPITEILYELI